MLPVIDKEHKIICYAYQDYEANRELRMLKELENNEEALHIKHLFPKMETVIVCGCNELAFEFVKYLERQRIDVFVCGKYWSYFGYENEIGIEFNGRDNCRNL